MVAQTDFVYLFREYNWTGDVGGITTSLSTSDIVPNAGVYQFEYHLIASAADVQAAGFGAGSYELSYWDSLNSYQATLVTNAFGASPVNLFSVGYSDVAQIRFVASDAATADITIGQINDSTEFYPQSAFPESSVPNGVSGVAYNYNPNADGKFAGLSNQERQYGKIWLNADIPGVTWSATSPAANDLALTVLHEIGHALGLKHPGDDQGLIGASQSLNSNFYSIMSGVREAGMAFNNAYTLPSGLQLYDIAAIQALYGTNYQIQSMINAAKAQEQN